jgi:hypothetical protein
MLFEFGGNIRKYTNSKMRKNRLVVSSNRAFIYKLVFGFGLACAPVRCAHPSFWAHCHAKRGAAHTPPIAASYSLAKKFIISRN